jgi:hypothetical protein
MLSRRGLPRDKGVSALTSLPPRSTPLPCLQEPSWAPRTPRGQPLMAPCLRAAPCRAPPPAAWPLASPRALPQAPPPPLTRWVRLQVPCKLAASVVQHPRKHPMLLLRRLAPHPPALSPPCPAGPHRPADPRHCRRGRLHQRPGLCPRGPRRHRSHPHPPDCRHCQRRGRSQHRL